MSINSKDSKIQVTKTRQLLAASALIPVVCALSQPPNFKALIYTVFIVNYLINTREKETREKETQEKTNPEVTADSNPDSGTKPVFSVWQKLEFIGLFIACGMIVQTLDYLAHLSFPVQPIWSPSWMWFAPLEQPIAWQFIMTFRVMVALSLAWLVSLRLFVFSEIEFITVTMGFAMVYTAVNYLPVISLPNFEAVVASTIYFGSIAGIAATPLALKARAPLVDTNKLKEKRFITILLLVAAAKLVTYFAPIPALVGG
ncbi:hypothetical protein BH11CYA1_BH11CYA1_34140 [soil metagenome]